jgi:hypothetical protein
MKALKDGSAKGHERHGPAGVVHDAQAQFREKRKQLAALLGRERPRGDWLRLGPPPESKNSPHCSFPRSNFDMTICES